MRSRYLLAFVAQHICCTTAHPLTAQDPSPPFTQVASASTYWLANVKRQGTVPYGNNTNFEIFRNVMNYGAKGDGFTDDTDAINAAVADGNRCGKGCDSSTVTPALVYFPPGTYMVSKPIVQLYYTQFIGDALDLPILKATGAFSGIAVIDSDPYNDDGSNWYTNQNNFFRQVRNFIIDISSQPETQGAGIHWQVAQATSLQNIIFKMAPKSATNKQQGIFMDNGSGGFMADLLFEGGNYGMFLGNQQFTTRNLTFLGQNTAIFMNWNWAWTLKSVSITGCNIGLDMANGQPASGDGIVNQTVGSVLLLDSSITDTPIGVNTSFSVTGNTPTAGGTLVLDNVDFTGCQTAVQDYSGASILAGGTVVKSWHQGKVYSGSTPSTITRGQSAPQKPQVLLSNGKVFERSRPQYESVPLSAFISIKTFGAKGDGSTDDTVAVQNALHSLQPDQILYFDHGAYIITDTIDVPPQAKITGEMWPLIMASGSKFQDQNKPNAVFRVGKPGETGSVEMSDLIFGIAGSAPGAVLVEWNIAGAAGANGLWDVHFRVGGYAGSQLQSDKCGKSPNTDHTSVNTQCIGAHKLFHSTETSSAYLENTWFWVSDHELDFPDHNQVDIYNGRGVLIESRNGTWLYGTSAEHSVLYNYQLHNAENVFMSLIQSETPYFQSNPAAPTPFQISGADPTFLNCNGEKACQKAWGLRIVNSGSVLVYGAGLYSFFDNYEQTCVSQNNCQVNMVSIEGSTSDVWLYGLSTKASIYMVTSDLGISEDATKSYQNLSLVKDIDNRNNFCATLALWQPPSNNASTAALS